MHGSVDGSVALLAVTGGPSCLLSRCDVGILDSNEWRCAGGSILLPDFQMFGCLFLLLASLLLSLSCHKHLLVIGRAEW